MEDKQMYSPKDKESKNNKIYRTLELYTKLLNGEMIDKASEAQKHGVNERSIQRDIDDIRDFVEIFENRDGLSNKVIYDKSKKGFYLERIDEHKLNNSEILAICKILLDSRAFIKEEMEQILKKLIECCVPKSEKKLIELLIGNEKIHYIELHHKKRYLDKLWDIGQAIQHCKYIEIDYIRTKDKKLVHRKLQPAAIMFSEYYFYLTAFIPDKEVKENFDVVNDSFPTIYRIDRIQNLTVLEERFEYIHKNRFEEGEFRKKIQFMYGGKTQTVKFKYSGSSVDVVLDRLPTAKILKEVEDGYIISAKVFGKGIDMWIRSQGDNITEVEFKR